MERLNNDLEILEVSAKQNSVDNILLLEEMNKKVDNLIKKEQNHARIAQKIGVKYHALNNCFAIKKEIEELSKRLEKLDELVNDENIDDDSLRKLGDVILKVSTLMNYLNNPKSKIQGLKYDRFEEMTIVEENELKRQIWSKIIKLKAGAELRVLDADEDELECATFLKKFIEIITGKSKIDEIKKEQIEFKRKEIKRVFQEYWGVEKNYSIHNMVATIDMFLEDNANDTELLEDEMNELKRIRDELYQNFVIKDEKVKKIIDEKQNKLLPVDTRKISKQEQLEIESYRFLSKNGYDNINDAKKEEAKYANTMAHEIKRITDYIDASI